MTETKLQHLKDLPTPPARDAARTRALDAAMAAFDEAAIADLPQAEERGNADDTGALARQGAGDATISADAPKDDDAPRGLKLTKPPVRRPRMQLTRVHYQLAASVAALVVAAPIAMRTLQQHDAIHTKLPPPEVAAPKPPPADTTAAPKPKLAERSAAAPVEPPPVSGQPTAPAAAPGAVRADAPAANSRGTSEPDTDRARGALLPHPEERVAAAEATTARKGNRRAGDLVIETPQGQLNIGAGGALSPRDKLDEGRAKGGEVSRPESVPGTMQEALKKEAPKSEAGRAQDLAAAAPPPVSLAPVKPAAPSRLAEQKGRAQLPADASRNIVVPDPSTAHDRVRMSGDAKVADQRLWLGQAGGMQSAQPEPRTATLMPPPRVEPAPMQAEEARDQFQVTTDNPVKQAAQEPVSTFSIDVDTASYSFVRRALNAGRLPPKDAVRVEEMINYFPYDYPRPESAEVPFQPSVAVFPAPWNSAHKLVHIGLKGYELKAAERPHANIVLLIDTSGSMAPEDRLPLLKNAFRMLVDELRPDDTVSIVTYAGDSRVALEPTRVADKGRIVAAIESLNAHGGTYGEGGIKKAYELAEASFDANGVNRIVLGTDGDFNIGISNRDELKGYIERKRDKGIFLSVVGVGRGNYNDALMQALAQNGNGTAAYVDTLNEARKVLVDEASSTLFTIAKDVKIQVEFNPALVSEYRLIGYETRLLKREDFNNDKVDAGDVGSGHTVTAIYEVTPAGGAPSVDALRYGAAAEKKAETPKPDARIADTTGELGFLKLRYKLPKEDASRLLTLAIGPQQTKASVAEAPAEARFATAVAAFGQLLRGSPYLGSYGYDDVLSLAQGARGDDRFGYRSEFLNLVRLAKSARK